MKNQSTKEFDPALKAEMNARRDQKRREARHAARKEALAKYLRARGLNSVDDDPSLRRIPLTKN